MYITSIVLHVESKMQFYFIPYQITKSILPVNYIIHKISHCKSSSVYNENICLFNQACPIKVIKEKDLLVT